ncbi:MAG: anion permease [Deltaproteobacteria bacterium]|nr:anion permease [Deltaproteobacteria bacterium]
MAGEELLISERERRFAERRRLAGLVLAPLLLLATLALHPANMAPQAATLLAIVAMTLAMWLTQALPVAVTALVGPALVVALGVAPAAEVFAAFGQPILFVFLGARWLAAAAERTRLDRMVAARLFANERQSPEKTLWRTALATSLLSSLFSSTSSTAMMVPVVRAVVVRLGPPAQAVGLLNAAFAASLGGILTPIANPANLIALASLSQFGHRPLPFFYWTLLAAPVAAVLLAVWLAQVAWVIGRERRMSRLIAVPEPGVSPLAIDALHVQPGRGPLGLGRGPWAVVGVLTLAFAGWMAPGLIDVTIDEPRPALAEWCRTLPEGVVAILASALLFVVPATPRLVAGKLHRRPVLQWTEAAQVEWGTMLLLGSGLALGDQVWKTGLASWMGDLLVHLTRVRGETDLTVLLSAAALVMSELGSSIATAAILCPLGVMAAQQLGISPVAPVVAAGVMASLSFLTPLASPPNAIAYASGCVPLSAMVRRGLPLTLAALLATPPLVLVVVDWFAMR